MAAGFVPTFVGIFPKPRLKFERKRNDLHRVKKPQVLQSASWWMSIRSLGGTEFISPEEERRHRASPHMIILAFSRLNLQNAQAECIDACGARGGCPMPWLAHTKPISVIQDEPR